MESPICFRILINCNFGNFEIKKSKCKRTLEQPGKCSCIPLVKRGKKIYLVKVSSLTDVARQNICYSETHLGYHKTHTYWTTHLSFQVSLYSLTPRIFAIESAFGEERQSTDLCLG